ncbi:MAG: hypothetical protein GY950_05305, partial [bacterium]|nr:hypothetical protein [bacterium]
IYDVVFKYLMEDNNIARLIISTIIKQNVVSLEFRPQERTVELQPGSLTVYRLDFSAKIETPQGHKTVLIELQKAKFPTDVIRFRKYLGEQYKSEENIYKKKVIRKHLGKRVEIEENKAIPILCIYFLGYPLEHFHIPVIRVQRECYNDATDEKLVGREEFIEGLTHDSFIIQVSYLRDDLKTELEKMLSIFDQRKISSSSNHHILNIKEENYPEKYRPIIRRLRHAAAEQGVRDRMDMEDEITDELNNMSRVIEQQKEILIEAEIALEQNKAALEEKDKTLEQNKAALEEKDKTLEEKEKALEEKEKLIRELLKQKGST